MSSETGMITWNRPQDLERVLEENDALDVCGFSEQSRANVGSSGRTFVGHDTNISVRSDFSHHDYGYFRISQQIPEDPKGRIEICMEAYDKVGIIRNIVDLMADFSCQGIRLCHPNKRIERFYRNWFSKVKGKERSERFLNTLFRAGNVIIERRNGQVFKKNEREWKSQAEDGEDGKSSEDVQYPLDREENIENPKVKRRRIPLKYIIHDPLSIEIIGEEMLPFMEKPIFGLRLPNNLISGMKSAYTSKQRTINNKLIRETLNKLPKRVQRGLTRYSGLIPLNNENVQAFYYKKDDWEAWAKPMVFAVISDVLHLEKIKLADKAALDGVISTIRLWRLGDLEHKILPSRAAIQKLRNILANNVGGGVMDLVWGPELDFKESNTQTHQFLGKAKYEACWTEIYAGLGIPPTLTGASTQSGFTNNFISIKTLIERLEYGRNLLVDFWNEEIKRVQLAMGFRFPATVVFGKNILSDESAEKALLIQLADRDIISSEAIQAAFGFIPEIENIKTNREKKMRGKRMPEKASPYHNPQTQHDLHKILLQGGNVAPSELGVELQERKAGEKTKLDMVAEQNKKFKPVGSPLEGRPKNSKDSKKRKQKTVSPRVAAFERFLWTTQAQKEIENILHPAYLGIKKKKNMRQLTGKESDELEQIKLGVLCNLDAFSKISREKLYNMLEEGVSVSDSVYKIASGLTHKFKVRYKCEPTLDEIRSIYASAVALSCRD